MSPDCQILMLRAMKEVAFIPSTKSGWLVLGRLARIRARKMWQLKLRVKLLEVFGECCAITGCSIVELLDACHIQPFSESGNCLVENAILLRSDIHDLFDANLLAIDPQSKEIKIHAKITDPNYVCLNGIKLKTQ